MLAISIKDVQKKEQRTHAHNLLRECLKVCGIDYIQDKTPVVRNEHGKPSLKDYPEIHYNMSHADGITACMLSDSECGIDCENVLLVVQVVYVGIVNEPLILGIVP